MVERLIAAVLLATPALAGAVLAQGMLTDPTRPPTVAPAAGAAEAAGGSSRVAPRLQSVLISPHRRLAVIDGRTVALGGSVGGATLVQVAETHVTLRTGGETQVLELHPGAGRKPATPREAKKKTKESP